MNGLPHAGGQSLKGPQVRNVAPSVVDPAAYSCRRPIRSAEILELRALGRLVRGLRFVDGQRAVRSSDLGFLAQVPVTTLWRIETGIRRTRQRTAGPSPRPRRARMARPYARCPYWCLSSRFRPSPAAIFPASCCNRTSRRGDEFRGIAIATAAVQNVVRRSWAASHGAAEWLAAQPRLWSRSREFRRSCADRKSWIGGVSGSLPQPQAASEREGVPETDCDGV
jgi:hypothetical protein